jgi:hypothetical protein
MRKSSGLVFCLFILFTSGTTRAICPGSQPPQKPAASKSAGGGLLETLLAVEKEFWEGWKNKKPEAFRSNVRDDGFFYGEYGMTPKAEIYKDMVQSVNSCTVNSYSLENASVVQLDAHAALLLYVAHQIATCGGEPVEPVMNGVSAYVKQDGRWINVMRSEVPAKNLRNASSGAETPAASPK